MSWVWILTIIPITFQTAHEFRVKLPRRCEEISVPLCVRVLPYNFTRFPNLVGHRSQVLARRSIDYYSSTFVEDANCAKHAAFFLCSFYLPICLPGIEEGVIKPCRFLCEKIKKGCPAIRKQWPSFLRCEELPKFSDGVCVQPMSFVPAHQPASDVKDDSCGMELPVDYQHYASKHFDYVIKFRVILLEGVGNKGTIIHGKVARVFKQGNKLIHTGRIKIWSSTKKLCPSIKARRTFLICSYESASRKKLVLSSSSVVLTWNAQALKQIRKWLRYERRMKLTE
nr:secreted frizzled-related protein 3-like [Pocillopora verrucosa]